MTVSIYVTWLHIVKDHLLSLVIVVDERAALKALSRPIFPTITSCSSTDYKGCDFKALVMQFMPNVSEYGLGGKASTSGDVYSFGILLLEMFIARKPTDEIFKEGLSMKKFVS
ncbi:LRR receptor-like kinase family protein, putative [Medicago truncatula]|uniref:LRR receptor-like kinase family protein, putative n=1 Tax=Medicago truncatula TaxID=3880 RepID=G7J893_MEDTR|nr:LRR receptor-like kinase family protein, putative [Medicago truncatula]